MPEEVNRGKLMREIAALYAKLVTSFREPKSVRLPDAERDKILRQIKALEKRLSES